MLDAYWRAANYLSVGQIYLLDNPLLREPLKIEHVKPRLLGHWGTTPGLNFVYAHMNRVIRKRDLNAVYVTGPGHGGPGLVANTYLEGTYTEVYPHVGHDEEGLRRLFRQFSFPGGIPSHVAPETPGSINEGGELGYSLLHAYGAALDNPDLVVCCVVGDGEAETGPLAASWHSNKFLNPVRDGAVLPVLHLNGYKIANPTVLARIPKEESAGAAAGVRLCAQVRRGRRAGGDAQTDGRHARGGRRGDRGDPAPGAGRWRPRPPRPRRLRPRWSRPRPPSVRRPRPRRPRPRPPGRPTAVADDRAGNPQGVDRPQGGRREAGGGVVALPPGSADRPGHEARAPHAAGGVAALVQARGAVRRARRPAPRAGGARAAGRAADGREPTRQRRAAAAGP